MNSLLNLMEGYSSGNIEKNDFMKRMWMDGHSHLFEYSEILSRNELIEDVLISKESVIFKLKNGIKLAAVANDYAIIPFAIFNFGKYEEFLWDKASSLLPEAPKTVFDIGGNIGYFSLYMSKKFPNAKFHCFEPVPKTYGYLKKDLEVNNSQNITAYNFGLSNKKQSVKMFFNQNISGASSMQNITQAPSVQEVMCEFSTLDDFVSENNIENIDFIKCDVEGAEKLVYEGGLKTLEKFKPIIYSEMLRKWSAKFNYHPNDIINMLGKIGYDCYAISDSTFYKIDEVTEDTVETNYIFRQK